MTEAEKISILSNHLAKFGGNWHDLPILLPAETVLEMTGESLRPRLYFSQGPDGREICLRPDLTIPAALHFIESGIKSAKKYLCSGKVFRSDGTNNINAHEINQLGIEYFGDEDLQAAEIDVFDSIFQSCKSVNNTPFYFEFSDASLIKEIIQSSQIDKVWKGYLLDVAGEIGELLRRLDFATKQEKPAPSAFAKSLIEISEEQAIEAVEEVLGIAKLKTHNSRGAKEIAQRMRQKAKRAIASPLESDFAQTLRAIIAVRDTPTIAIEEICRLSETLGINLQGWQEEYAKKFKKLGEIDKEILENGFFVGAKAGRFEYYDGFTFDFDLNKNFDQPFVSGGRYDGLIGMLSNGEINSHAIGAVIRAKRI